MTDVGKAIVHFACPACGARLSWAEDTPDDAPIACNECGQEIGTYGDMRDRGVRAAGDALRDALAKAIKRR